MTATKKPKAKKANCECWRDVDDQLKERGFRLDREMQMDFSAGKANVVSSIPSGRRHHQERKDQGNEVRSQDYP